MMFWLDRITSSRSSLQVIFIISLYLGAASVSLTHAELYITDDYLQGLDDEVDSVAADKAANKNSSNQSQTTAADISKATQSRFDFETLLRIKHPTSYAVYNKLSTSDRILIYDKFKSSKNLFAAKQMIIKKFESR